MFLTKNPFSDHGPSKQVLSEAFKYHIPEDIPANERTAFHGAAAAAAKAGKKSFNFGGKTHPVTMKKDTAKAIADQKEEKVNEDPKHYAAIANANARKQAERDKADPEAAKKRKEMQKKIDKMKPVRPADIGRHSSQGGGFIGRRNEETMSFREKLMSLFEGDRAAHYKGATKPEEYDEKQKSSKGAMDMLKTPKSVEADGMKAAKDTAANIAKSAPGRKMRSNDKKDGDATIIPAATPVNDPSGKRQTAESYGISGNKVSDSLLKAYSVVQEFTHEFDVDSEKNAKFMVKKAKESGMKAKIHTMKGPGGGNPVVHLGHKDNDHMHKFIKKHYDNSYEKSDLNMHKL